MPLIVLNPGLDVFVGTPGDDEVAAFGVRTATTISQGRIGYTYTYGVYDIGLGAGADRLTLYDVTAIDPDGVNPRGRQNIDAGSGDDFIYVGSPTAATIFGQDGADYIWKADLRTVSLNPLEQGSVSAPGSYPTPDGLVRDAAWLDFDILSGGAGNDTIVSGNGDDWVYGGADDDTIAVAAGVNVVFAGDGADSVLVAGVFFNRVSTGGPTTYFVSNDLSPSSNAIWMGAGNDVVSIYAVQNGSGLVAAVNGEDGDDIISVSSTSASWLTGGAGNDTLTISNVHPNYNVFTIQYPPAIADTLYGEDGDDVLSSDGGDDMIVGGAGADWILGGFGADAMYGGAGSSDDAATDRFTFDQIEALLQGVPITNDVIYDFQPASRYAAAAGKSDIIDIAALLNRYDGYYGAGDPFADGEIRTLVNADSTATLVQILHPSAGWATFLTLYGVLPSELNTSTQANLSGGGGDFLWYTG